MKRSLKWSLICVPILAALGVGALVWRQRPLSQEFYTDAQTIRSPREAARVREILWRPPVKLSEVVNTSAEDYEPRLSWDGLTLFFVRGKAGENADIYTASRTPTGWTEPEPLVGINGEHEDLGPEPSSDGNSLYFYSDRPDGQGGYDIWVSRKGEQGWLPPTNLGPLVNSEFNDYGPALTPGGDTLYFASNRPLPDDQRGPDPDAWPATVREDLFARTYDLYSSPLTERGAGQAQPLNTLNSPANEGAPCVSPAGDFVYFGSDRPGGEGGFDIFRARRIHDDLEAPANLGPTLNTAANELDPGLTNEGFALYFSSDRPLDLEQQTDGKPKDYDLFFTSSREVFIDVEQSTRPPVDFVGLFQRILPNLLWALLAATLLLLLWMLAGGVRSGKLTLLARCLLASLMLHLTLMMALNFWRVSASVLDAFRQRGEIRVALAAPAAGDIAAQIRGALSDAQSLAPATVELVRYEQPFEAVEVDAATTLDTDGEVIQFEALPELDVSARDAESFAPAPPPVRDIETSHRPSPTALEITTPVDVDRVKVDEPELAARAAPAQEIATERPPTPAPTTQPANDRFQNALAHVEAEPKEFPSDATSFVSVPDARDAPARLEGGVVIDATNAARPQASAISNLSLKLPNPEAAEAAADDETSPRPAAVTREASRPPVSLSDSRSDSDQSAPLAALEPESLTLDDPSVSPEFVPDLSGRAAPDLAPSPQLKFDERVAASNNPIALEIELPSEIEPPASSSDPVEGGVPLRGRVTNAQDGGPLPDAVVQIDLPDAEPLIATTDAEGRYALAVPQLPENFAITASRPGFVPLSVNVPFETLRRRDTRQDFELAPLSESVVAVEETPTVHHLGNDLWDGTINSQFQKDAEGRRFAAEFEISGSQLPPNFSRGAVQLMAKGVQCPHRIYINGLRLRKRLDSSPRDGSFGEFSAPFPPEILVEGVNTVEVRGVSCQGDIDDFEFVNVQIRLSN